MRVREPFTLDRVHPHGRGVEEQVHEVVVEQIDFVDVEEAAVGLGEQTRLEPALALSDGGLQIERPHDPVLGRGHGQVDHAHLAALSGQRLTFGNAGRALVTQRACRVAEVRALGYTLNLREERGEAAHGG